MDKIIRTLICGGKVQATVIDATGLVRKAAEIHHLSSSATKILGGLLIGGAYFASVIKGRGNVSVTVKAKDGDGAVSVSGDSDLHIRGYADGACEKTLVGGVLTVVRDDGYSRPFVGTCEIDSDNVSDVFSAYFQKSEQIPTAVSFNVQLDDEGNCIGAGGMLVQLMPDASDDDIELAEDIFYRYTDDGTPVASGADEVYAKYIEEYNAGLEKVMLFPEYKCNCSQKKITGVLASVGKKELLSICDEAGEVRVHCHYCNKDYVYDRKLIEELF